MRKKTASLGNAVASIPAGVPATSVVPATDNTQQKAKCACDGDIRICAYLKWEAAGKPDGDGMQFWLEAEREMLQAK